MTATPGITLETLAARIGGQVVGESGRIIQAVSYDSRAPMPPGAIFACIRGFHFDGHQFAAAAAAKGAAALLVDHQLPLPLPQLVVADTRQAMGELAAELYGRPSRQLRVLGVTGTKGKTTTTFIIKHLLQSGGISTGLIGTTGLYINDLADNVSFSTTTTPEAPDIQQMLARMLQLGCRAAVMEVTSHAVALRRTAGTEYDVAVFTNIAADHLDFHPTFEHYLAAKNGFFALTGQPGTKERKAFVVNRDDPHWSAFAEAAGGRGRLITVGIEAAADLKAGDIDIRSNSTGFTVSGCFGRERVEMPLLGRFNVYNALCALAAACLEGVPLAHAAGALADLPGVPGRFEKVDLGQDFTVIVDYAHTGPSMANCLQLARGLTKGRLIVVFGAGGDRDPARRREMGEAAGRLADRVIITSDNPRSEDPLAICRAIEAGVAATGMSAAHYEIVPDRREAINLAIAEARPGDLVLIAGKGHENYQEIKGRRIHFDDREEARLALERRRSSH